MRFVRLQGSPRQIGLQRGKSFGNLLSAIYKRKCASEGETETKSAKEVVEKMNVIIRKFFPELVEEMEGTAKSSGLAYQDIVLLNFSEEISFGEQKDFCSQIAFSATDNGPMLAKSEDAGTRRTYVVTEICPDHGYRTLQLISVDWIVGSGGGVNEKGLCVGQSTVWTRDKNEHGIPRLILPRVLLQYCSNVGEAINFLKEYKLSFKGMNFMLLDNSGAIAVIEKSPFQQSIRRPDQGSNFLCCTNHFLTPTMWGMMELSTGEEQNLEILIAREINSKARYARLLDFARKYSRRPPSERSLKKLLRSHGIGGICQHGLLTTTFSLIVSPAREEISATDTAPCNSNFVRYRFTQ